MNGPISDRLRARIPRIAVPGIVTIAPAGDPDVTVHANSDEQLDQVAERLGAEVQVVTDNGWTFRYFQAGEIRFIGPVSRKGE